MQKYANLVELKMQSIAYFLAKFCFDTAENEPAKNLQKTFQICDLCKRGPVLLVGRLCLEDQEESHQDGDTAEIEFTSAVLIPPVDPWW